MAKDVANNLSYFLLVEAQNSSYLGRIRDWSNLKVGFEEERIWVKDLDYVQLNSLEVKTIPNNKVYYEENGKLFPVDSMLPEGRVPSLMWTPIERAFPIRLPSLNHNFFGISEELIMNLVETDYQQEVVAMITSLKSLGQYLESAPTIRLQNLKWVILDNDRVFLKGMPLLPIDGSVYWQKGSFLLPAGFNFELFFLSDELMNKMDIDVYDIVVWKEDGTYFLVRNEDFQQLSLSSYRMTVVNIGA